MMIYKRTYFNIISLILIVLTSSLFTLTGCGEYREFRVRDSLAEFSFEYPSSFPKPYVDTTGSDDSNQIMTRRIIKKQGSGLAIYSIIINIMKKDTGFSSSFYLLESTLRYAKKDQDSSEFVLINRSMVTVGGVIGEQLIYQYSGLTLDTESSLEEYKAAPRISYEAYFEKDNILWSIRLNSELFLTEQIKVDFEHLLNTLKFR